MSDFTTGRQINFPEYQNFLKSLQDAGGPFKFVTKSKHFPVGGKVGSSPKSRSLAEIEKSVLESSRVKNVITEETIRRGCERDVVRKEAADILKEMAHKFGLTNVRSFGYFVCSAMEKLYDGIYVNEKKLLEIKERSKKDCVVFMPSHKAYFDFILLSLICFQYDIQLPAIAAGMDFMSMKFMGEVLRRSGAFFMRRSFGNDNLYWAVFSEYVQTHVVNNDRTVEFFVEGTRSRVGKSLHPKYGLLQIVLEPYLRGSVFDIVIVPVSINYDKVLEEKLYAYELLGFPKPKESTGALLKARELLQTKNGNCFLTFGDPISVRDYFGTTLHRNTFVCQPDSQFVLDPRTKGAIKNFAHHVVDVHNKNAVITVWNVTCMAMLQILDIDDETVFSFYQLHTEVDNLLKLLTRLEIVVNIRESLDDDMMYYLNIHKDLFVGLNIDSTDFKLQLVNFPVVQGVSIVEQTVMERSVSRLILTTYSNAIVHAIDSEAILCTIISNMRTTDLESAQREFSWIHELMKREFVTTALKPDVHFRKIVEKLEKCGVIESANKQLSILDTFASTTLKKLILPYFYQFECVFNYFDASRPIISNLNDLIPNVQKFISETYQNQHSQVRLSFLSTEPIKNAFAALYDFGAMDKTNNRGVPNFGKLQQLKGKLAQFTLSEITSSKL